MIKINLLPVREARRKAELRQQGFLLAGALVLALLTCGVMHSTIAAQISAERTQIGSARAELKKLKKTLKDVARFRKEKEAIEAKLAIIARLEKNRQGPVLIMDELSSRIPERLWIKELKLRNGLLELTGASTDNEIVAGFMTSLEESALFRRVELKETSLKREGNLKINAFRITAREAYSGDGRKKGTGKGGKAKRRRR